MFTQFNQVLKKLDILKIEINSDDQLVDFDNLEEEEDTLYYFSKYGTKYSRDAFKESEYSLT